MSITFLSRAISLSLVLAPLSVNLWAGVPKAAFPDTQFTFNAIQGTEIEHEFVLRNEGAAALRILGVRWTAPLTFARVPAHIEPGGEVRMRVHLNTAELRGPFEGQILISLNDPVLPEARLLFQGRVVPSIELSPQPVFFVAGQRGERREAAIEIINHGSEALTIHSVEHPSERFTTRLETLEEGRRYRLSLILDPNGPGGRKTDTILVKTSSQVRPLIRIPANTYLRERVYTFPAAVDLGTLRLADIKEHPDLLQQTAQTLMVYQSGGSDFRVKASTNLPILDLKWERGPKGDRYQSAIALIGDKLQAGPINGSIVIDTNDPEFPSLVVPVTGVILGP